MRRFFGCYLLVSLGTENRWYKGRTYIGFTVNPQRRIRQHNGEVKGGAKKTAKGRRWEMVMVVYGFPTKVAALQFEWAWQNPQKSKLVREAVGVIAKKDQNGVAGKVRILFEMLHCDPWRYFPLTTHFFSTDRSKLKEGCRPPPGHMPDIIAPMDDLPECIDENPDHHESDMEEEQVANDDVDLSSRDEPGPQETDGMLQACTYDLETGDQQGRNDGSDPNAEKAKRKCIICRKLAKPSWVSCECGGRYHVRCLADHLFTEAQQNDYGCAEQQGKCTDCSRVLVWMDVLSTFESNSTWNSFRATIEMARNGEASVQHPNHPRLKAMKPRQPKKKKRRGLLETVGEIDAPVDTSSDNIEGRNPLGGPCLAGGSAGILVEAGEPASMLGVDGAGDCALPPSGENLPPKDNGFHSIIPVPKPVRKKRELVRLWERPDTPHKPPDPDIPSNPNEAVNLLTPSPCNDKATMPQSKLDMGSPIGVAISPILNSNIQVDGGQLGADSRCGDFSVGVVGPSSSQVVACTPERNSGGSTLLSSPVELLYTTPCPNRTGQNCETVDLLTPPQFLSSFQRMSVERHVQGKDDSERELGMVSPSPPDSPVSFRQRILQRKKFVEN